MTNLRAALLATVVTSTAVLSSALPASAATDPTSGYYTGAVPLQTTNWNAIVTIPKFDPALGTLTGVECGVDGYVEGTAFGENTGVSPNTINIQLKATQTLTAPDSTVLVQVVPLYNEVQNLPGFDGSLDFGGTSGFTLPRNTGTVSATNVVTTPSALTQFIATSPGETINLPMSTVGQSVLSDTTGNSARGVTTKASVDVRCRYQYEVIPDPVVPEVALAALLPVSALAVAGGALVVQRRRNGFA